MNMSMHISLEFLERAVEFAVTFAAVRRCLISVAQFPHGTQRATGRIMFLHHHLHRIAHGSKERRLNFAFSSRRAFQ